MEMNNTRLKELIAKYLDGTATDEERQQVEAWYQSFEGGEGLTGQLGVEQEAALGRQLYEGIERDIETLGGNRRQPLFIRYRRWMAAAGIVLLIGLAGAWLMVSNTAKEPGLITAAASTAEGVIKKVHLPDGSTVWLNAASSIRFAQRNAANGKRELWLEGEGFFDVAQQPDRPFIVHVGKLAVNVLGTSFNIDGYNPEGSIAVTVSSGKVAVNDKGTRKNVLARDEQVVYDAPSGRFTRNVVVAKDVMAWTSGQLVFRKLSFRDIAERLERRYKARIRFENDSVAACLLTAAFDQHVPLEDVLAMLCRIYGYSYRREGANSYMILDNTHGEPR
jgi:transmembrane sensor